MASSLGSSDVFKPIGIMFIRQKGMKSTPFWQFTHINYLNVGIIDRNLDLCFQEDTHLNLKFGINSNKISKYYKIKFWLFRLSSGKNLVMDIKCYFQVNIMIRQVFFALISFCMDFILNVAGTLLTPLFLYFSWNEVPNLCLKTNLALIFLQDNHNHSMT